MRFSCFWQTNGEKKNNDKSDILCLADTLWARSGSGCPVIPWNSATGPIIPRPTSIPVPAEAWMWERTTGGRLAPATNTLTSSASQVSNGSSPPHLSTHSSSPARFFVSCRWRWKTRESAVPQLQHSWYMLTTEATFYHWQSYLIELVNY